MIVGAGNDRHFEIITKVSGRKLIYKKDQFILQVSLCSPQLQYVQTEC